ncbi:uncharacterized protein [Procambarus clarkii]|uniref:uncharacterized protein n=1 Tax=Procambarus clarkii TaxID=6728 RepID=UPI0037429FC7
MQLRQVSWCVTVVVVSDDLTFLATFAQWSLKGRLLVWSTRLLVVTRLPHHHLHHLRTLLSNTNSMLIIYEESLDSIRCGVYLQVPYSPLGAQALKVASWTPQRGLALTSSLPLFPDKFSRFLQRPTLKLATEINPLNIMVTQEEVAAHEGVMLQFAGPAADMVSYIAKGLNFSYIYLRPPDGSWGIKREDGSWSGMVGMVIRQEVDVAVGPFALSGIRSEVVDFTEPFLTDYYRILGARGRPEVNPWGFLFPLEPLVWAAILGALLVLPLTTLLMASCFSLNTHGHNCILPASSAYLRILLNQSKLMCMRPQVELYHPRTTRTPLIPVHQKYMLWREMGLRLAGSLVFEIVIISAIFQAVGLVREVQAQVINPRETLQEVRLVTIYLPHFHGRDDKNSECCWNTFDSLVNSKSSIRKPNKFFYLRGTLEGEAKAVVEHLIPSDKVYDTAVQLLEVNYSNKEIAIAILYYKLRMIPTPDTAPEALQEFRLQMTIKRQRGTKNDLLRSKNHCTSFRCRGLEAMIGALRRHGINQEDTDSRPVVDVDGTTVNLTQTRRRYPRQHKSQVVTCPVSSDGPLVSAIVHGRVLKVFLDSGAKINIVKPSALRDIANVFESPVKWSWERVVLAVWGLVTVVLTQSYAGNLMALLAVRNLPQPIQSLQDVLDDRSVISIWEKDSSNVQYMHEVDSGIYHEFAGLEEKGRLVYRTLPEFPESMDTLVRKGDHVLVEVDFGLKIFMSRDFTVSGQCSFYQSREEFLPMMLAMAGQKGSPIVSAMSKRIRGVTEAGLFRYWMKAAEPNSTVCYKAPTTITVQESLSLNNIWGMFVILAAGHAVGVFVLCLELVIGDILHCWTPLSLGI